jgi:hypothetical protein
VEDRPILGSGRPRPDFPSGPRAGELERQVARRTLALPPAAGPVAPVAIAPDGGEDEAPPRRDPLLVALAAGPEAPAVVLEANALRHSRLGELVVGCLLRRDPELFRALEAETGIDVLKDVDRVGLSGETAIVSGFFDRARWDELERMGMRPEAYGDGATLWSEGGSTPGAVLATWGGGLVLVGPPADVRRSLDQLAGRVPVPPSALSEEDAYGEVYGVVPGAYVRHLLRGEAAGLGARLADAASAVELHVDAMRDVAGVVRVRGDAGMLGEVARSVGAALAVARVEAEATDDRRLAELLEFARVTPGEEGFSLEVAVPAERLEEWFRDCAPLRPRPPPAAGDLDGPPAPARDGDPGAEPAGER